MMVGLSVVLESTAPKANSQVINKSSIVKKPPITAAASGFLDFCSLCRRRISPADDIYMYKGDRAFCSEECRCRQIFMDEEEEGDDVVSSSRLKENCGFAAGAASSSGRRKGARNRGGGGAAAANGSAY